ncbi:DUF362 domain-containing protein [Acetivibrio straminisolvens]|jgi:uncharacterized protein (DUF362 family)/Pyruvate/2-oxoacid:ferredoxin oxidoreductase delta subunit|uniref:DUF362 domain-containing protein n=1 Tax=Acetivibrio straminisolvens TaxID=253314 RepID=UPI00223FF40F|nr:DUF362 domain-containing protein [Acetivibrio straminisolvens]
MSKVALIRCESYDYNAVKSAVKRGLDLIGGPHKFAAPDEKILLKPNLVTADPPERCSTTHPSVFKAVAELFMEAGITNLAYGDSPGIHKPITAARKAGLEKAANELGIKFADFSEGKEVFFENAIQNKKFIIANGVLESNGIISLPKLKTHGFARMTGCVKNQFGCVPGPLKGEFHARIPSMIDFSKMLVDLNVYLKPRLFVMDGIMAMEGNGPRGGTPKKMNAILISSDPIALDATVCRMINLNPEFVPTIVFGKESGLGTYNENEIEIVGDDIQSFITPDFDVRREPVKPFKPGGVIQFFRNSIVPKPYIKKPKCIKCGVCVNVCPVKPKALGWRNNNKKEAPTYTYRRCIRCYCCQELCPESAIHIKVPFIRKFFYNPNKK